ncbi:MAG TPA: hypothetical protein VF511_07440 [Chthoniobacterales bacterium]|jgi:hypothetical protein
MKISKLLTIICAAIALTSFHTLTASAHEGHDHGAKNTVPDTADGIMKEIHKQHELLAAAIAAKNLKAVHDPIEALPTLAKALPDKVAAGKKTRVQGSVNNLTKVADTLHQAADAGDQTKAEAELKKLEGVLQALDQQVK